MPDFDWSSYKDEIIAKRIKQFNSVHKAIVEMDAIIESLIVEKNALSEMIDWQKIEKEVEEDGETKTTH